MAITHYAVGGDGTLAYVPGAREHALVLVGTDGSQRPITDAGVNPRVPDEVAVSNCHSCVSGTSTISAKPSSVVGGSVAAYTFRTFCSGTT